MSPSRNQTPGAISLTVFGCASPRVTTNARANIATNTPAAIGRANLISRLLDEPAIPRIQSIESQRGLIRSPTYCRLAATSWQANTIVGTILHLLEMDHKRLTYFYNGRNMRLTDVAGELIPQTIG